MSSGPRLRAGETSNGVKSYPTMSHDIKKINIAVLPVAGLGARVMPLTLHQPKAMIGIVDRPMIHYTLHEMTKAGIKRVIMIISPEQTHFKLYTDYLNRDPEWRKLKIKFEFVTQKKQIGNADPVWLARRYLKNRPFIVAFPDDLLVSPRPATSALIAAYHRTRAPMVLLERIPKSQVFRYGVVKASKIKNADIFQIHDVVEKPSVQKAPSNLTIVGRYVLTPEIMKIISQLYPYRGKEIGIADALKIYAQQGGKVYGWLFKNHRFDAGSKLGILKAQAYFGLHHPEMKKEFRKFLKRL